MHATLAHIQDFYGHKKTLDTQSPIDIDGRPVPWITYSAIHYLEQLDLSQKRVFEYGAGASTEYWSARCAKVISVENDKNWFDAVSKKKLRNVDVYLASGCDYIRKITLNPPYDVICIDGRWRFDCSQVALPYLAAGGIIILDNSERYPAISQFFRDRGLIQVDMIGPGPINRHLWATSIFFSRDFSFRPCKEIQPRHIPGLVESVENQTHWFAANEAGSY